MRAAACYKLYYFANGTRNENMYKSKAILSKIPTTSKEKAMNDLLTFFQNLIDESNLSLYDSAFFKKMFCSVKTFYPIKSHIL